MDSSYCQQIRLYTLNNNFNSVINLICNNKFHEENLINALKLVRDTLNDPLNFVKNFSQPMIKNALEYDFPGVIQFFIKDYEDILDPDEMSELLWNACVSYGVEKTVSVLLTTYKNFKKKIICELFEESFDLELIEILLDNYNYKITTKLKTDKLLEALDAPDLPLLNTLLTDGIVKKCIVENARNIYDSLQPNLIKRPNTFSPILERLMRINGFAKVVKNSKTQIASLYTTITPDNIYSGPLEKDLYTQELEFIAKYTLHNPNQTDFFIHQNHIFSNVANIQIDLSKLIKQSNLSHIVLKNQDSNAYLPLTHFSTEDLEIINGTLPDNYTLKNTSLEYAERICIFDYSDNAYEIINSTLYEKFSNTLNSSNIIRDTFLKILFLASGLNKIYPSWTRDPQAPNPNLFSYRGEEHLTGDELNQRVTRLLDNNEGIIQKQIGFCSTSSNLDGAKHFENSISRIQYAELYGKNIRPLSKHPTENEHLQLPGYIHLESYQKHGNLNLFEAKLLTPLYHIKRSIQQEHRFKKLLNLNSNSIIVEKNPFEAFTAPLLLEGLIEECQFVYEHYLCKHFTEKWIKLDWELSTSLGIIPRPNHGLAHVMRVAHLVPIVAKYLMHHDKKNIFNFTEREINIVQLTALFSVAGRQNEAAFNDQYVNNIGYKTYTKASAEAFVDYVNLSEYLDMTKTEIALYRQNIKKMGSPDNLSFSGIVLTLAHKLDLLRCYDSTERIQESIVQPFSIYIPQSEINSLLNYTEKLLHATGNRVTYGNKICDYSPEVFYMVSTNVEACYHAISSVTPPTPHIFNKRKILNDEISFSDLEKTEPSYKKLCSGEFKNYPNL